MCHGSELETDQKRCGLVIYSDHGKKPGIFVHNPIGIQERFDCDNRKQCPLAEACFLSDKVRIVQVIFRMDIIPQKRIDKEIGTAKEQQCLVKGGGLVCNSYRLGI